MQQSCISRRAFVGGLGAACAMPALAVPPPQKKIVGVQLYSLIAYIRKNGLEKALADVAKIGYGAVEFQSLWGKTTAQLKKILDDTGLVACGAHVRTKDFSPERIKATSEFHRTFGNNLLICAGEGNFPRKGQPLDDFLKRLVDYYNKAAETAAQYGCKIGLHNHTTEFDLKMKDGTTYWDYFFSHTRPEVCMEHDVGWTLATGNDPCEQWRKYPHRSITMHARENGGRKMAGKSFDGILGKPAPGYKGVNWAEVSATCDADGVKWWIFECSTHFDSLLAVSESFKFLQRLGRC